MIFRQRPHESDPNKMYYDLQNYALIPKGEPWPERPATHCGGTSCVLNHRYRSGYLCPLKNGANLMTLAYCCL